MPDIIVLYCDAV